MRLVLPGSPGSVRKEVAQALWNSDCSFLSSIMAERQERSWCWWSCRGICSPPWLLSAAAVLRQLGAHLLLDFQTGSQCVHLSFYSTLVSRGTGVPSAHRQPPDYCVPQMQPKRVPVSVASTLGALSRQAQTRGKLPGVKSLPLRSREVRTQR